LTGAVPRQVEGNSFHLDSMSSSELKCQRLQLFLGTRNQNQILFSCGKRAREAATQTAGSAGDKSIAGACFFFKLV
jgi:hypothetical protein